VIQSMVQFYHQNPAQFVVYYGIVLTAVHHLVDYVAHAMDEPVSGDGHGYKFLYNFMQNVAGNYKNSQR
jgi:hypothetical protein